VLPAAGVVRVVGAVRFEDVVKVVLEAAVAERGGVFVPLGGVIVDDIEDDLEARPMQRL